MKKLIFLLFIILFTYGCATSFFQKQTQEIDTAYQKGEITKYQALQLKNDLYKSAQQGEDALIVIPSQ